MQSAVHLASSAPEQGSSVDLLKRAIALALELEQLLRDQHALEQYDDIRLRLARAHSLSVVDALTELVCRPPARESMAHFESGVYAVAARSSHD
jgi:hypothetical protein